MCGIAGIITPFNTKGDTDKHAFYFGKLKAMTNALRHRGPDGEGFWNNAKKNVFLGHRRLSIIDLSPAGAQPMHYVNRYSIIHNGEIYNYLELKESLQKSGYKFHSASDTEVILAAYDLYKEDCVKYFDGMFAFAIWDEKEQRLFAARDRFGEKPFYYWEENNCFFFAGEMKALWAAGAPKKPDDKMLLNYLALGYVQHASDKELTFFQDIYSLPPAHYLTFSKQHPVASIHRYWKLDKETKLNISEEDAVSKFQQLLSASVIRRLRSDVTIGTSLSGGLDSSTIVAMIDQVGQRQLSRSSFSAVFPGFEKDESKYIRSVTEKFHLKNFQTLPSAEGLLKDFERLCYHQEEPFSSASVFAQFKVFELAGQQQVKVLLDGQGADETLAGYHKYIQWFLQELISRYRFTQAKYEMQELEKNGADIKWSVKNIGAAFLPAHAAIMLEKREYLRTIHHPDIDPQFKALARGKEWDGIHKPIVTKLNDILYFNMIENGLEELLRFADRNSMAHGVEVRLPFLSHELVKFIFSLPSKYKIRDGWTKYLLRKTMDGKLPDDIVWRKDKVGYEPPQQQWMTNPQLQDYIHEAKTKLVNNRILSPKALDKKVEPRPAHAENNFDWRYLAAANTLF